MCDDSECICEEETFMLFKAVKFTIAQFMNDRVLLLYACKVCEPVSVGVMARKINELRDNARLLKTSSYKASV